jgi:hypothetical protein
MSCSNTGGRRRSRKMRGGNGYGVGAPIAVGALSYVPNLTSVVGGAPYTPTGGRRRRRRGGAVDLDAPPVVGDMVADDGSKLFPEQQCVGEGRTWTPVSYGYTLIQYPEGHTLAGLLGKTDEIANPKNDNGDPLGRCSGTKPPPNMGASAPTEEGGRRRRRSRKGKSRRSRRRTMRGGGSVSSVGAGFTGSGSRGIADYVGYESNVPVGGAFAIPTGTR